MSKIRCAAAGGAPKERFANGATELLQLRMQQFSHEKDLTSAQYKAYNREEKTFIWEGTLCRRFIHPPTS